MTTLDRNNKIAIIAIAIAFAIVAITIGYISFCFKYKPHTTEREQRIVDSLNIIRAIEKKQAGKEISILMNENSQLLKDKAKIKHEKDSIKKHEKQLIATNTFLINKMRQNAPKECQPYIDSCNEYHNQIEAEKDAAYNKQAEELCKAEQSNENLMKVIGIKDMEAAKDSANYTKNMQVKDEKIADLTKSNKRAKFWSKVVTWVSLGAIAVITGVTMIN